MALGAAVLGWLWMMGAPSRLDPTLGLITPDVLSVRPIRVLLESRAEGVRVHSGVEVEVRDGAGTVLEIIPAGTPRVLTRGGAAGAAAAQAAVFLEEAVTLTPLNFGTMDVETLRDGSWSEALEYPGELALTPQEGGGFSIINRVDVERYVACVTSLEAWPTFATEALRGQAIVARTYALDQMLRRGSAGWDVSASAGSQVYRGVQRREIGRRASAATGYTAGVVCVWDNGSGPRLFPTYYSAACGGRTQSGSVFGAGDDIPPLKGGVACDYCRIAPGEAYRWGPVKLPLNTVWERLAARYPILHQVWPATNVEVVERADTGHVRRVRITAGHGAAHELGGENFRLALGAGLIRSTHFSVRVEQQDVHFEDGRGYGHGIGLCQWGMQGQALAGKAAESILRFYYPGSGIARVY